MKYTKGTPTILGEITLIDEKDRTLPYSVKIRDGFYLWLSDSEIDAIICKPKRNIDHLIELIEARKKEEAVSFIDNCQQSTSWSFWLHMLDEYAATRKYPVLSSEELKAVKWLVKGGYEVIELIDGIWPNASCGSSYSTTFDRMPIAKCLRNSAWITETPINLKELLEAQEDV